LYYNNNKRYSINSKKVNNASEITSVCQTCHTAIDYYDQTKIIGGPSPKDFISIELRCPKCKDITTIHFNA
jgi:hypothetical protein